MAAPATNGSLGLPVDAQITPATSIEYWTSISSTVDGMLGGFPQVSRIDIAGSRTFIVKLLRHSQPCPDLPPPHKVRLVTDTGAGIGRITVGLLSQIAQHVDVVEPIPKFTEQLKIDHPELFAGANPIIQNVVNTGLESWDPSQTEPPRLYDIIWNQWCLGHLTDKALIAYLRRLIPALSPHGWIVVKENVVNSKAENPKSSAKRKRVQPATKVDEMSDSNEVRQSVDLGDDEDEEPDLYDELDSSVTRTERKFDRIFRAAGLKVVKTEIQRGFGKDLGLYPVRMWGLQPATVPSGPQEGPVNGTVS
ncbi:Alpha N-terminal protein methyltransferase 1 [Cyphellophora attinorum]|uniref:Alpha N-terminal protein methyltransferase 1 n=1 Tax=Cyphellophora attinorum TaxID=1664694 RepID=A0A0N1HI34_9EURO|nr:Alpha N-terminal protein methyltransferase 1 [Phialophora attinorum]KPI45853.1 Alpha N-terminal protein methyltransferase 1 [Phialophora attinorum]